MPLDGTTFPKPLDLTELLPTLRPPSEREKMLQAVRDLLEQGWIRNASHSEGRFCLLGGIYHITTGKTPTWTASLLLGLVEGPPAYKDLVRLVAKALRPCIHYTASDPDAIMIFNDTYALNKDHVLTFLDGLILAERKKTNV